MTKAASILLLIVLVCGLGTRAAQAGFVSTASLEAACTSDKKEQIAGCLNYIAGVLDYHILMQSFGTQPVIDFCLPDTITIEDAGVAVMKYLKSHPQHDALASAIVPLAMNDTWPCHPIKKAPIRASHSRHHKH